MLQSEVINKLSRECCLAMGDFHYFKTVQIYIQMALSIGLEHFSVLEEEIVALYMDGSEAGRFKGIQECERKLGISHQNISKVLNGSRHSAGGLMFIKTRDYELTKRSEEEPPDLLSYNEKARSRNYKTPQLK